MVRKTHILVQRCKFIIGDIMLQILTFVCRTNNGRWTFISFDPISAGGGAGVSLGPRANLRLSETPSQLNILKCVIPSFPIYLFTNKLSKKMNFLGGCPPFGPLKSEASQK